MNCKRGIKVPDDILVSGFGNIKLGDKLNYPITTVNQPFYKMAFYSVKKLLALIDNQAVSNKTVFYSKLIIKKSCGCNHNNTKILKKNKNILKKLYHGKLVLPSQIFNRFTFALNSIISYEKLNEIIHNEFEIIGIKSCYIVLYNNQKKDARIIVNYNKKDNKNIKIENFDSTQLIPGNIKYYHNQASFMILNLSNNNRETGYIIFEMDLLIILSTIQFLFL